MVNEEKVIGIINSLQPDFKEYADNGNFFYWMDYATELDDIENDVHINDDLFVIYLNKHFKTGAPGPKYDACVDVASNLEEAMPDQFKGVFKYE
jgi:hypothetical protein